jgi:hypothetical protein
VEWGLVSANGYADGIFCRDTVFDAAAQTAFYVDGGKGCGLVNCTIQSGISMYVGLNFCNNDMTADLNLDDSYSEYEKRTPQYIVYVGNTIYRPGYHGTMPFDFLGGPVLVKGNNVIGPSGSYPYFVKVRTSHFEPPYEAQHPTSGGKGYYSWYPIIKNNDVDGSVNYLLWADGANAVPDGWIAGHVGKYTVTGNHVDSLGTDWVLEEGVVDTPNTESGNTQG